jgi:hypothetical protein
MHQIWKNFINFLVDKRNKMPKRSVITDALREVKTEPKDVAKEVRQAIKRDKEERKARREAKGTEPSPKQVKQQERFADASRAAASLFPNPNKDKGIAAQRKAYMKKETSGKITL